MFSWRSGVLNSQFLSNETPEAIQILNVQLNVIVSSALHPEGLHGLRAALVQGQAVRKVDHLVLCPVDDENRRSDFRHFFNAEKLKTESLVRHHWSMVNIHWMFLCQELAGHSIENTL